MFIVVRKLFKLLSPRERFQLILLFVAQVGVAGLEMAGVASIMPFMAVVTNPSIIQKNHWLEKIHVFFQFTTQHEFLLFLGIVVMSLMIFSNLSKAIMTWLTLAYDNRLNYMLSRRLLASYLGQPYEFFLNRNTYEMGKNVLTEVRTVITGVLSAGMSVLSSALIIIFLFFLLMLVDPFIAITIICALGGIYGMIYLIVRRRLSLIGKEQVGLNTLKYRVAGETLGGIKELKILGREINFLEKFSICARRHARNNVIAGVTSQLPRYALEIMAFGGILLMVLSFLGDKHKSTAQMVPILALYAFAGYRLLPALQQIFSGSSTVRFNKSALDVLEKDLRENQSDIDPESAFGRFKDLEPLRFKKKMELKNVSFGYAGTKELVIKRISLTIENNTTIGFVGTTGSGKTTLVDIILGLLTPLSGQLLADGITIDRAKISRWQRNLGYVPQTIYLCDDTVKRNIAFGVPDVEINHEAVVRAAHVANLSNFIETELPDSYETIIGEQGVRLSGGQRQRIGIARALYNDPALLIMDEATSALDGVTEEAVMTAIRNLLRKKTIIIIAHRLTTVKDCDMIYLLNHGQIVNQGSYYELQSSSAWFREAAREETIGYK
jgi:ABC-type multidrug transport system fused ATPase/permease subunit